MEATRSSPDAFKECHTDSPILCNNPRGHTLGIIGLGAIGYEIARKSYVAFGMRIIYHDIVRKLPSQESEFSATFYPVLEKMLAASDCVVLATPATPDGKKIMTRERFSAFKVGSRFVNIARGSLVDEEALADAVDEGRLICVGLDVHENEPVVNERLKGMRSVTLTAHNAGGTLQT